MTWDPGAGLRAAKGPVPGGNILWHPGLPKSTAQHWLGPLGAMAPAPPQRQGPSSFQLVPFWVRGLLSSKCFKRPWQGGLLCFSWSPFSWGWNPSERSPPNAELLWTRVVTSKILSTLFYTALLRFSAFLVLRHFCCFFIILKSLPRAIFVNFQVVG